MSNMNRQLLSSKVSQKNLSNENIKNGVTRDTIFLKVVHFGILIHVLSWRQQKLEKTVQKHKCFLWLLRFSDEFFDMIIDAVENFC